MIEQGRYNVIFDCDIMEGTVIWSYTNLYKCTIGKECQIGSYVEIGEGSTIGNYTHIGAYSFIPPGIHIGDNCFIAPGVMFANDPKPPSGHNPAKQTYVGNNVKIGLGCHIAPGIVIGGGARIRMRSFVTRHVKAGEYYRGENYDQGSSNRR
jgi:acetyltransferase-like isoleucine patch superfamily enzyme